MVIVIVLLCIIAVLVLAIISMSNKLNKAIIKIDEANSGIDVALTKRYDVLTKMIDVVKGYTKYETEALFKTIELRKGMSIEEKNKANADMGENFAKIQALAENYPELKASEPYRNLQQAIVDVEEHLQAARRLYNSNVSSYNQMIVTIPMSIIANSKGFVKKEFFVAEEIKREDVKIDL